MADVNYGVVQQNGVWTIIGKSLKFGAYRTRRGAEAAARRLALKSAGLPVRLHVQDEAGELKPPIRLI